MRLVLRLVLPLLVVSTALVLPLRAQTPAKVRPTVATLAFDYGTVQAWWGNDDIGKGIADMITDHLINDSDWRVFERTKLNSVLGEQDFNQSDRVDPSAKAAKIGKMIGVRYLVYGTITKFGTENDSKSVGGGGYGGGKFGLGAIGTKSGKAFVALNAKVTDTTTGEVLISVHGEGTSKRSGLLLGGGGGGGGKGAAGGFSMGSSDFRDTILGEATELAVKDTVTKMLAKQDKLNNGGH